MVALPFEQTGGYGAILPVEKKQPLSTVTACFIKNNFFTGQSSGLLVS